MRRMLSVSLALCLALCLMLTLLVSCGGGTSAQSDNSSQELGQTSSSADTSTDNQATTSDETLIIAMDGEPTSLFPNYQTDKVAARVDACLYDTLVRWDDETGSPVPCLATEWNWDDELHITFTLRDDVVFSNGETLTANDVLESFRISATNTVSSFCNMVDVDNCEIIDDTHIKVALTEPYSNFVDILGSNYFAIFSAKAFEDAGEDLDAFARNPVGSGPYILSEWKEGESITLTRNENYWDTENVPYYQTMCFYFIGDSASRVTALQSGSAQVAFNVDAAQLPALESDTSITINPYIQNVTNVLMFDTVNFPVLADLNVRRAILLGINKDELTATQFQTYSSTSHSSFVSTGSPYYADVDEDQDIELAKQLIADSGYSAEELTFTVYGISGNSTSHLELFQAQMKEIGVTINIETLDLASYFAVCDANEVPISFAEGNCWDSTSMTDLIDSRVETPNLNFTYMGDKQDELHAMIDAAHNATSEDDKKAALLEVQQFLVDNAVCTAVNDTMFADAWSSDLTGMTYDVRGWPVVSFVRPVE